MPKICPLRMLAEESNTETRTTCGTVSRALEEGYSLETVNCLEENCAWWNDDFGECAIMALATRATRPVVLKERLGHD